LQLGITSTALGANGLAETFQRAAQTGAEGLELAYRTEKEAASLLKADYRRQLVGLARSSGVAVTSLAIEALCQTASLIGSPEQIKEAKKLIRQAMDAASDANVKVVLVPFFGKNTIESEDELGRAANALLDLVEPAEGAGVIIGVESTMNFNQQRFLLDHLGNTSNIRIYQDTANALARKLDLPTGLRDLGAEAIVQVHFRDVRIEEGKPPDYGVALGQGNVDFRAVAQALRAIGYDGWVVLDTPPADDPVATGRKNLQFAQAVLAAT
jgi:sugar phosphate isomerase/epimerase